jgi:succinyl-CoA synthetase alpha subunit
MGVKLPQRFPGCSTEEEAASFIKAQVSKPVVAFIAGQTARLTDCAIRATSGGDNGG